MTFDFLRKGFPRLPVDAFEGRLDDKSELITI